MKNLILITLFTLAMLSSCRYKLEDKVNWDTALLAPILKSGVTLSDAIRDTNLLSVDENNFVTLVFRDTLIDLHLIDQVTVPDTAVEEEVRLESISLSTDSLIQDITLGQIARQLEAQGNPIGTTILSRHGDTLLFLPPITGISSGDVTIDASQFFQTATLLEGQLEVTVTNRLPVNLRNITYHLRNNGNLNDTLIRQTIAAVGTNNSQTDIADLTGKTVENTMAGKLENIDTDLGSEVKIDTNDYIRLKIKVANLKASNATAIFPAQTVIDDNNPVKYYFGEGIELTKMTVGSGEINVRTISTINDTLEFIYTLPSARKNGMPVVLRSKLLPAPIGDTIINAQNFDLAGYAIDLSLNGDSTNLFPQNLKGNLFYSGNVVTMDLNTIIKVNYGLLNIVPSYVEGYLGKQSFSFRDQINLDFFDRILGGSLNMKNPRAELVLRNSVGMDGELSVNSFSASNTRTGQNISLNAPFVNTKTFIPGPKLPNIDQTVETRIQLNKNNSNIRDFISLLPDRLFFDLDVKANENGNPSAHNNFATSNSAIQAFLDLQIPLDGIADQILLADTVAMDLTAATVPVGVESGTLKLYLENSFPMEAQVQIYFLAENGQVLDSLFHDQPGIVPAGTLDANGYVSNPAKAVLSSYFDIPRMDKLTLRGKRAVARFTLSTKPLNEEVKIYSTYGIQFKMVGDFQYMVSQ